VNCCIDSYYVLFAGFGDLGFGKMGRHQIFSLRKFYLQCYKHGMLTYRYALRRYDYLILDAFRVNFNLHLVWCIGHQKSETV